MNQPVKYLCGLCEKLCGLCDKICSNAEIAEKDEEIPFSKKSSNPRDVLDTTLQV